MKRALIIMVLIVSILLASVPITVQEAEAGDVTISGTCLDPFGAVADANVVVTSHGALYGNILAKRTTTSGSNGRYSVSIPDGIWYKVAATKGRLHGESWNNLESINVYMKKAGSYPIVRVLIEKRIDDLHHFVKIHEFQPPDDDPDLPLRDFSEELDVQEFDITSSRLPFRMTMDVDITDGGSGRFEFETGKEYGFGISINEESNRVMFFAAGGIAIADDIPNKFNIQFEVFRKDADDLEYHFYLNDVEHTPIFGVPVVSDSVTEYISGTYTTDGAMLVDWIMGHDLPKTGLGAHEWQGDDLVLTLVATAGNFNGTYELFATSSPIARTTASYDINLTDAMSNHEFTVYNASEGNYSVDVKLFYDTLLVDVLYITVEEGAVTATSYLGIAHEPEPDILDLEHYFSFQMLLIGFAVIVALILIVLITRAGRKKG